MTAQQIMNYHAMWWTWDRTALDCDATITSITNLTDWLESGVLVRENTLSTGNFVVEVTK